MEVRKINYIPAAGTVPACDSVQVISDAAADVPLFILLRYCVRNYKQVFLWPSVLA